jgi:hypothetical protein
MRRRRSVVGFGSKEEKTLLTGPASLEIARLSGLEAAVEQGAKLMQIGSVGRLLINYFLVLNYFQNWLFVCAEGDGIVLVV